MDEKNEYNIALTEVRKNKMHIMLPYYQSLCQIYELINN